MREEFPRSMIAERGIGQRVAGLRSRAGLDVVGVDRHGDRGDPRRAGDHPLPAVLDGFDAPVGEPEVRLVVHAVQALHHRLLQLVDDIGALARLGVDLVDPLVVHLHLEVRRPAAVAPQPGLDARDVRHPSEHMVPAVPGTVEYAQDGAVATLTLARPERLNTITPELAADVQAELARANADASVRVVRLRGAGRVFCAGYDIDWGARMMEEAESGRPWDPMADLRNMSRFVFDTYMALWRSPKPVIAQVHGFCVGGGTDFALCSDLIVCAEDAYIGYPPARVWGSPTTMMWTYRLGLERAKRLLLTGDAPTGRKAAEWGLASEAVPADELDAAALALAQRVALLPRNQLHMMKLLVNQAYEQMGLRVTQLIGTLLDGDTRHTPEGVAFSRRAQESVGAAVAERDAPFGDYGQRKR